MDVHYLSGQKLLEADDSCRLAVSIPPGQTARLGISADTVAARLDASLEEVRQVQAELAPPAPEDDPAAEASRTALRARVEADLAP